MDLRLFKRWFFFLGNMMNMWSFAASSGFGFLLVLFLQELQLRTPSTAGLIQAPSAALSAVVLFFTGRYYTRVGPRRMLLTGYLLGALGIIPFLLVDKTTAALPIIMLLILRGVSGPMSGVSSSVLVFGPLENSRQGVASSMSSTTRQIAASLGVALVATVQLNRYNAHLNDALKSAHLTTATQAMIDHAHTLGYREAFLVTGLMLLVPAGLALLVNDHRARSEMNRRPQTMGRAAPAEPAFEHEGVAGS
jgi:MFS family permease